MGSEMCIRDRLGYDFLDTTGISKSTANTTGFFCLAFGLFLVTRYREHFPEKGIIFDTPYQHSRWVLPTGPKTSSLDYHEEKTPEPEPEKEEGWWED